MEEQFNKEAKEGWRCAGDASRTTDESASNEDQKHTSGGVFVAVDSWEQLLERKKEQLSPSQKNEGGIAQVWVNVRGCVRMFAA